MTNILIGVVCLTFGAVCASINYRRRMAMVEEIGASLRRPAELLRRFAITDRRSHTEPSR